MRHLVLLALASCASDTSKLEMRVAALEKEIARARAPATADECAVTHDVTVPHDTRFDAPVRFEVGESHLSNGDDIVIQDVHGTSPSLAVNGMYMVRGEYTLASADEAEISFTVRARDKNAGCTSGSGHYVVKRGSGIFQVATRIAYEGDASISFFRLHETGPTTRKHEIGSVYFGNIGEHPKSVDSIATKALARATCTPIDISFPAATKFPEAVPFELGRTDVRNGDRITIREVRGTRKDFAVDGIYVVRGDYTLASADEAVLGLNVTGGCTSHTERGHVTIKKGSGAFELAIKLAYVGQPHVTFYVNGEGSGGVYFGKGDFLLK